MEGLYPWLVVAVTANNNNLRCYPHFITVFPLSHKFKTVWSLMDYTIKSFSINMFLDITMKNCLRTLAQFKSYVTLHTRCNH